MGCGRDGGGQTNAVGRGRGGGVGILDRDAGGVWGEGGGEDVRGQGMALGAIRAG